jgi:hypothetical protein
LRGFHPGRARFPLSSGELDLMEEIRSRIACVLADCGFTEAAGFCRSAPSSGKILHSTSRPDVESIVRSVMQQLSNHSKS